jgi:hypothetical protein
MKNFINSLLKLTLMSILLPIILFAQNRQESLPGTCPFKSPYSPTDAGLNQIYSITGLYSLSVDAIGSNSSSMQIQINKPTNEATVQKAILFSAVTGNTIANGCITFAGLSINWDGSISTGYPNFNNYWADVTSIVVSNINGQPAGNYFLPIVECYKSNEYGGEAIDGEVLMVIFNDVTATEKTIIVMWGSQNPDGDNFQVTFAEPFDPSIPGATLDMGLGIGFSYQLNGVQQFSEVSVNNQRITSSAGGEDDGASSNGALITVGGLGDLNTNPTNPFANPTNPFSDDELYSLLPLISNTTSSILINTINPSFDDNIFLAYFSLSGTAIIGEGILLSQIETFGIVGTDHTVKAAVFNDLGQPVSNRLVTFNILSGPNMGATYSENTDANGEAFYTYTGTGGIGIDQIQACFLNNQNQTLCSNILSFEWIMQTNCTNPIYGGEIGYTQYYCGEFDPLPFESLALPTGYVGNLEYKWQYSTDFVSFFDIVNSNFETYDPGLITQTTWFKRLARVDCMPDWMGAAESNVLEVVVYDPIAVTITESLLPEFCQGQGVILTAVTSITPAVSYLWSTGETTESIFTGVSGTYSVLVTNTMGCTATASYDLTVDITELLSSYVMLARGYIQLYQSTVHSGGLGVKAGSSNKVLATNYSMVTAEGTFAKAPNIFLDWTSNIVNKYYAPSNVVWPAFEPMTNPGILNIVVPANATMTLSGNAYKTVRLGQNATVTFTEPVVDINGYITMAAGSKIKFEQCTKIHLKGKFTAGNNVTINPDELSVVFYIEGDAKFGSGAHVNGVFYLSNAEVYTFDVANSTVNLPGIFKGMFLAKVIYSGKNNNWYMSTMCNYCMPLQLTNLKNSTSDTPGIVAESGAVLRNYPNPFNGKTTISFMLPADSHVTIDVFDLSGQLVQTLYNNDVNKHQDYSVEFDGSALSKGLYFYKMTTNTEVVTRKMIVR